MRHLDLPDMPALSAALRDSSLVKAQITVPMDDHPVHFRFHRDAGDGLVIRFHPAVDRANVAPPVFQPAPPHILREASVISPADPNLEAHPTLRAAWYAGREGFDSQARPTELFAAAEAAISPRRTVFTGSSSAGLAALYYSFRLPDSVAVVSNPQTRVLHYYRRLVSEYRAACWPSCRDDAEMAEQTCLDMADLYAKGMPNTVIYLQSSGDHFHLCNHAAPFLAALSHEAHTRLVFDCRFYGRLGHGNSVSVEESWSWVSTVLAAESPTPDDLLMARYAATETAPPASGAAPAKADPDVGCRTHAEADAVSDWLLGREVAR